MPLLDAALAFAITMLAVATVVALAFNIDSVNILGSFISNPMLSTAVATKAELQRDLDQLNSGIFPFGWSYFPYGQHPPKP